MTIAGNGGARGIEQCDAISRRDAAAMLLASAVPRTFASPSAGSPNTRAIPKLQKLEHLTTTPTGTPIFGHASAPTRVDSSISVQSIGGALPAWVEPSASGAGKDGEIVLVRKSGTISDAAGIEPLRRIVLAEKTIADIPVHDGVLAIYVNGPDLDVVAETFLRVMTGSTIIGIDLADIHEAASYRTRLGRETNSRDRVYAIVFDGFHASRSPNTVVQHVLKSGADGGLGNILFVAVLAAQENTAALKSGERFVQFLYDVDSLFQSVATMAAGQPIVVTTMTGMSRDAIVIAG